MSDREHTPQDVYFSIEYKYGKVEEYKYRSESVKRIQVWKVSKE